ncbi:hypothetical protein MXB_589 [Myxobolus squamalis]|nr:hypothetical protein MXB_589 [Myxobolus squamalis]
MSIENVISFYMYAVNVEPAIKLRNLEKEINVEMMDKLISKFPNSILISDTAKIIYSNTMLDDISSFFCQVERTLNRIPTTFSFAVTFVKQININDMLSDPKNHAMLKAAFETIVKNSNQDVIQIRSGSYNKKTALVSGSNNFYEIWSGWRDRVIISPKPELLLNIDLTFTSIINKGELIDLIRKIIRFDDLSQLLLDKQSMARVCGSIKGIEVKCKHVSIKKKIVGLITKTALTHYFDYNIDGKDYNSNVKDYFMERYQRNLKYPQYPLVQIGPVDKNIYLPIELALVNRIQSYAGDAIMYGNGVKNPENGRFYPDSRFIYYSTSKVNRLFVCNFSSSSREANDFINALKDAASSRGVSITLLSMVQLDYQLLNSPMNFYKSIDPSADMVMMLVPDNITSVQYGNLKSVCDLRRGIVSQVIKKRNVELKNRNVLSNIVLKINAKAGGINFCASISQSLKSLINKTIPYMVMGADVTHPLSGSMDETGASLASVVSSLDPDACRYTNQAIVNSRGRDVIDSMDAIIKISLSRYEQQNKQLPKRIIMFRDGLSEGQFLEARAIELTSMQKGCATYKKGFKPLITFICVQKRHHTRFYPTVDPSKEFDCHPGLVVNDSRICEPDSYYLLSHKRIKGTAKAAHYKIIHDDSNFTTQQLVEFSFILCHNYSRCSQSVSLPTPTYYAHLCAFRSHFHRNFQEKVPVLVEAKQKMKSRALNNEEYLSAKNKYFEVLKECITPHQQLTNSMYFV